MLHRNYKKYSDVSESVITQVHKVHQIIIIIMFAYYVTFMFICNMADEKKTINLSSFPRYDYNPSSIQHGIIGLEVGGKTTEEKNNVIGDAGEVVEQYTDNGFRLTVYDRKNFVKIYEYMYPDLVKLSSQGVAVFSYIISNLREMQGHMTIRQELFGEWYKKLEGCENANAKMICYRGIIDLLTHKIIYIKTGDNSYYININKFFNGKVNNIGWVKEIDKELAAIKGLYNKKSFNKRLGWIEGYVPSAEEVERM